MNRIGFPVNFSGDPVGEIAVDEITIVKRLGPPHATSNDSTQFPSPVSLWAFELHNGVRVVVEFYSDKRLAYLACDPPDLDGALDGLGLPTTLVTWRREPRETADSE
jgi:hypothetical protein